MAPLTFYRCPKCKREFDQHDDAVDCERSHLSVKRARAKRYTVGQYPFTVDVTFSNGKTKTYILEDMASTLERR